MDMDVTVHTTGKNQSTDNFYCTTTQRQKHVGTVIYGSAPGVYVLITNAKMAKNVCDTQVRIKFATMLLGNRQNCLYQPGHLLPAMSPKTFKIKFFDAQIDPKDNSSDKPCFST